MWLTYWWINMPPPPHMVHKYLYDINTPDNNIYSYLLHVFIMIVALMTDSAGRTASVYYDYILKYQFQQLHVYIMIMDKHQMIKTTVITYHYNIPEKRKFPGILCFRQPRRQRRHVEGFKLRSSNLTHALLIIDCAIWLMKTSNFFRCLGWRERI